MPKNQSPAILDRLAHILASCDVKLKRSELLQVAAYSFGYRNSEQYVAAHKSEKTAIHPAELIGEFTAPTGDILYILKDPIANSLYAVDESFLEQVVDTERRESVGLTPYGHLIDLSEITETDMPSKSGTSSCNSTVVEALKAAMTVIDEEIENRKHAQDPSLWAELQKVYKQAEAAIEKLDSPDRYIIQLYVEDSKDNLYWSNEDGWTCLEMATVFEDKNFRLPVTGLFPENVRWVGLPKSNSAPVSKDTTKPKLIQQEEIHVFLTDVFGDIQQNAIDKHYLDKIGSSYQNDQDKFIPLTKNEMACLYPDNVIALDGFNVLVGASVLFQKNKFLCPMIEFTCEDNYNVAVEHMRELAPAINALEGYLKLIPIDRNSTLIYVFLPFSVGQEAADEESWLDALKYLLSSKSSVNEDNSVTADFEPQVWIGDNAMAVQPMGDTVWDATFEMLLAGKEMREWISSGQNDTDFLKDSHLAPKWISNWMGPFEIRLIGFVKETSF